jgi:hypothetical protein
LLNSATDNSVAKFSNGFATDCIFIIFLILATGFSNGKSVAKDNIESATDYPLLIKKKYLNFNIKLKLHRPLIRYFTFTISTVN